jgi:hypothetical protein
MADEIQMKSDMDAATAAVRRVCELLGIRKVIIVDDEYAVVPTLERALAACKAKINANDIPALTRIHGLQGVLFDDDDLWEPQFRDVWERLGSEEQYRILSESTSGEYRAAARLGKLSEILTPFQPQYLSLQQWKEQEASLLPAVTGCPTLFLFDLDMSKDNGHTEEGIQLISGLLQKYTDSSLFCGLLSHNVDSNREYHEWKRYSESVEGLDRNRDRFAVISKRHLPDDPVEFARRFKRIAISPRCHEIKDAAFKILKDANIEAEKKLQEMDVYNFEQMVFQSSNAEGVWELDTLFRLYSLYHHRAARDAAKRSSLETLVDQVRKVVDIEYTPLDAPAPQARKVAQLEIYEEGDYLNNHHAPLDVGDIFRKNSGSKQYILLAQPCDLMCRVKDQNRAKEVQLAEVIFLAGDERPSSDASAYEELCFYSDETTRRAYVDFRTAAFVPICILDLVVFTESGTASFNPEQPAPSRLIPAWQLRHERLCKDARNRIDRLRAMQRTGKLPGDAMPLVMQALTNSRPGLISGSIDLKSGVISYDVKRIRRLKQPRAGALITKFAQYQARAAFDHDLTRTWSQRSSEALPASLAAMQLYAGGAPSGPAQSVPAAAAASPPHAQ